MPHRLHVIERLLILMGCACSAWVVAGLADAATFWRPAPQKEMAALAVAPTGTVGLFARLDIPALHLSLPVVEGTDTTSLRKGVGHIPGTARPGGLGNVGLAGHRDTVFRPLQRIAENMEIVLANQDGAYRYRVQSTDIVSPESVRVLDISSAPELTLVTCFPFDYVGSAPYRFVVHARLVSAAALPDASAY